MKQRTAAPYHFWQHDRARGSFDYRCWAWRRSRSDKASVPREGSIAFLSEVAEKLRRRSRAITAPVAAHRLALWSTAQRLDRVGAFDGAAPREHTAASGAN